MQRREIGDALNVQGLSVTMPVRGLAKICGAQGPRLRVRNLSSAESRSYCLPKHLYSPSFRDAPRNAVICLFHRVEGLSAQEARPGEAHSPGLAVS